MFVMHISAMMAYLGMIAGAGLFVYSARNTGNGSFLGKFIGSLVLILSLLSSICIGYYGATYWAQGAYESPMGTSMQMHRDMMEKMMGQGGMMNRDQMMGQNGMMNRDQMMGQGGMMNRDQMMGQGGMMNQDEMDKMAMEKSNDRRPIQN